MSFKAVASKIEKKEGVSSKEAAKRLAGYTYKLMKKKGKSVKHGIPKNVWGKKKGINEKISEGMKE